MGDRERIPRLAVRAWEREHTLDAHAGKKSPAGPLSPARSPTASERTPETAGETRQDGFVPRDTGPMPERKAICGDCGASMTFPAGGWEDVQRSAIDAWAKAHEL